MDAEVRLLDGNGAEGDGIVWFSALLEFSAGSEELGGLLGEARASIGQRQCCRQVDKSILFNTVGQSQPIEYI